MQQQPSAKKLQKRIEPFGGGGASTDDAPPPHRSLSTLGALCLFDALALWVAYVLAGNDLLPAAVALLVVAAVTNWVFLSQRMYPWRWLLPGFLTMLLIVVYPLGYTIYIAFTNYGDGHLTSKEQVIEHFEQQTYLAEDGRRFAWTAYRDAAGNYLLWLTGEEGESFLAGPEIGFMPVAEANMRFGPPEEGELPATINDHVRLSRNEVIKYLTQLEGLTITADTGAIRIASLNEAQLARQLYTYDPERDLLVNNQTGAVYTPHEGTFVAPDGSKLSPGYASVIGWENFGRAFTNPQIRKPFLRVFIWTFVFAGLSVFLTFGVGLGLALVLNDQDLPLKGIWRALAIVPYTIPGFISILVWVGLLNPLYGPVNKLIVQMIGLSPQWFSDPNLAKVAILFINTWLGYPYMLIVSLGALQAIPNDLYEAAAIDGAAPWQQFRQITLPLLLVAIGPLLIGSFAFNFNNFAVIELITEGGPPVPGASTPAGHTDILISYTYRLAFSGGRGTEYGFAAAISIIIFLIIAVITALNFRFTRTLEEVSEHV